MSKKQLVTEMPGKTILPTIIKVKDIVKNTSTKIKKYSIKEQELILFKIKELYFIRSILAINRITMAERNT